MNGRELLFSGKRPDGSKEVRFCGPRSLRPDDTSPAPRRKQPRAAREEDTAAFAPLGTAQLQAPHAPHAASHSLPGGQSRGQRDTCPRREDKQQVPHQTGDTLRRAERLHGPQLWVHLSPF